MEFVAKYKAKLIYNYDGWGDFEVWEREYLDGDNVYYTEYISYFEGLLYFETLNELIEQYEEWASAYLKEVLSRKYNYIDDFSAVYKSAAYTVHKDGSDNYPYSICVMPITSDSLEGIYTEIDILLGQLRKHLNYKEA